MNHALPVTAAPKWRTRCREDKTSNICGTLRIKPFLTKTGHVVWDAFHFKHSSFNSRILKTRVLNRLETRQCILGGIFFAYFSYFLWEQWFHDVTRIGKTGYIIFCTVSAFANGLIFNFDHQVPLSFGGFPFGLYEKESKIASSNSFTQNRTPHVLVSYNHIKCFLSYIVCSHFSLSYNWEIVSNIRLS